MAKLINELLLLTCMGAFIASVAVALIGGLFFGLAILRFRAVAAQAT
jgi:hypothetical protein